MSSADPTVSPSVAAADFAERCYRKVVWRILPLLFICYFVAYIDRVNVAFAQLQMKKALGFDDAVFGLGAGLMFIGYFLFEVPSNILLSRIGARKNLSRILVLWGIAAAGTMLVTTPAQFYAVRILLGVFEAGFFPGVVLYLTYWFPPERRGRIVGIFFSATVFAGIIAGPISGATMKYLDGVNGWGGWQWLYLTQGLPAIALGVAVFCVLRDRPDDAPWLDVGERALLTRALGADAVVSHTPATRQLVELLRDPRIYLLILIDFLVIAASYTLVFWSPSLIQSWGVSDLVEIGLCSAIPSLAGAIGMIAITRSSDLRRERRWHFLGAVFLGAAGLFAMMLAGGNLYLSLATLSLATFGIAAAAPLVVTVTADYLPPSVAPAGIALVTACGILGGAAGPTMAGFINTATQSNTNGLYGVVALLLAAGLLMLLMRVRIGGPRHAPASDPIAS